MNPGGKSCKQWPCREGLGTAAHGAVLNLLLLEQLWEWTKAPSRALLGSRLLQGQIKGANFSVKIHLWQGFEWWLQSGDLFLISVQSRPVAGRMFRWLKCQKLLEVLLKYYSNISVTHSCITDFCRTPFCRSFLTLVCKEPHCWKCLQSSSSFTGAIFHLKKQSLAAVCSFWCIDQFFQFCVVNGPSGMPQQWDLSGVGRVGTGGQRRCWGNL